MRRLSAVSLAAVVVVPVLSFALIPSVSASAAGAASAGASTFAGGAGVKVAAQTSVEAAAKAAGAAAAPAAVTKDAVVAGVVAAPVATRVRQVTLSGVDQATLRGMQARDSVPGARGAPGAVARMTTSVPAILTKRLDTAPFQTLGVTWKATTTKPDLVISVRSRGTTGWSGWDQMDDDAGDDPTLASVAATKEDKATNTTQATKVTEDTQAGPTATKTGKSSKATETPQKAREIAVRGGTDPLWVGPSTGVQVRIVVRSGRLPAGLKLELVDPGVSGHDTVVSPTATNGTVSANGANPVNGTVSAKGAPAANGTPAAKGTVAVNGTASANGTVSAASANKPVILSRAQWGADERRVRYPPTYMPSITATVLHHTAGRNNYSASQVPSILRGDYAYHLSRGWYDIGYNALVDRFGRIWEGRAGGLERAVMGAHAGGFNYQTFGVAMIGNYDVSRPSAASIEAVARVMAWKLDLDHRDPYGTTRLTSAGGGTARYSSGRTVSLPVIMGHRNTGFTACPGRYLYPYLGSIRNRVRALMKASLLNPSGPPSAALRGKTVAITARALAAQSWRLDVTAPFGGGQVARVNGSAAAGEQIKAVWNGRVTGGALARPGRYRLTLSSSSTTGTARPVSYRVLVVPPAPAPEVSAEPSSGTGGYFPLTPTRLLDTRTGGRLGLGPNGRVDIPVLGQAGVPATGVSSVVLNLTASQASDDTSLSAWPTGRKTPGTSTGVPAGVTRSSLVTTRVGAAGTVSVGNAAGVVELTADVVGYFADGGLSVRSIASTRIYNSAQDPAGPLVPDQSRSVALPAVLGGIAAEQISGVIVDVSALSPTGPGTLTAYRPGTVGDLTSLTYRAGESVDNLAFVEVSGGAIAVRSTGTAVNAVLDVRAVMVDPLVVPVVDPADAGRFTAVKPVLVVDTRTTGGPVRIGHPRKVVVSGTRTGVPAQARAVLVSLTGIAPAVKTWLKTHAWAETGPAGPPGGTALRVAKGDTRGNLAVVPIGPGGAIMITNARGGVQVRVDLYGYLD
jgi:hypothetical protein